MTDTIDIGARSPYPDPAGPQGSQREVNCEIVIIQSCVVPTFSKLAIFIPSATRMEQCVP